MTILRLVSLFLIFLIPGMNLYSQVDDLKDLKAHYKISPEDQCLKLWSDTSGSIKQIVLIRHGEPDLNKKGWRNRKEAIQYMHDYDSVGVKPLFKHPLCLDGLKTEPIYMSPIPRAASTAELAFPGFSLDANINFREFERKTMKFCNIKMPLKFWTTGSRILWFMGMNKKDIESSREAKKRARNNAEFLVTRTGDRDQVILVAHGLHNKYVKKYLRKMGWKKVYDEGNGYLSVKVLAND